MLIALAVITIAAITTFREDGICAFNCSCDETQVICTGLIPEKVAASVRAITLTEIHYSEFYPGRFCNVTWSNVTELSISPVFFTHFVILGDHVFDCLSQLKIFKFSSSMSWFGFSEYLFVGLTSLFELDMSGSFSLTQSNIYRILSRSENCPNLTHLILANTGSFLLDQKFVDVLCYRPLTNIDLSFNPVRFYFSDARCLCKTLNSRVTRYTRPVIYPSVLKYGICSSLKLIDGRTLLKPEYGTWLGRKCMNQTIVIYLFDFFLAVHIFYAPTYVNNQDFPVANCSLHLYPNSSITELHMINNALPNFDIKMYNPIIQFIDLSYNNIETFNPNTFLHLPSLVKVDLSHNNLHMMTSATTTWLALFKRNKPIQVIDMSFNQLTNLPKDTFKSNVNLRELNLQGNRFEQITFDVSKLLVLEILDLRNNSVHFLDEYTIQALHSLYEHPGKTPNMTNTSNLEVLLFENPLICSCSSHDFLQWFVNSPLFSTNRSQYNCKADDKEFPMTNAAVKEAKEGCDRAKQQRSNIFLASVLSVIALLLLVLVVVKMYKRHKRKNLDQRYADRVRLLQENNIGFKYPVFLSYSSDDREFVLFNILRPLRVSFFLYQNFCPILIRSL